MAIEVSCAVWKWSKQKGSNLLLLIAIADYANAEGIAWPSVNSLSQRTRMGPRYVQKMLRQLEEDGEIVTVKRTNTSSVYRVTVRDPAANPSSPPLPNSVSPGGELPFAKGANPSSPNPSGEPSMNHEHEKAAAIYQAYPRKIARTAALKAIVKALAKTAPEKLLTATLSYAAAVEKWPDDDKRFIPYPATWFNRGSYEDDPQNWTRSHATSQHSNGRRFEQTVSYAGVTDK